MSVDKVCSCDTDSKLCEIHHVKPVTLKFFGFNIKTMTLEKWMYRHYKHPITFFQPTGMSYQVMQCDCCMEVYIRDLNGEDKVL